MDTFTIVHVVLSLVGILSGLVVLYGLLTANRMNGWTMLFLVTTVATSVTGFGFPFHGLTPAIILGILSLMVLTAALRVSSHRLVALDLCRRIRRRSLLQCFRAGRAGLSENASPPRPRAQRVRAALCHRAGYCAGTLHPWRESYR